MTDIQSDANFSLLLGEGIAWMYHHPPGGAKIPIGEVRESEGNEELQWSVLRRRAFRLGSGRLASRILLPEWLVNYSICYAPGPTDRERSEQIKQGLIGRTGYNENVSQLVFDWCGDGEVLQVAAVALDSLKDAANFAGSQGLNPVAYSASPNPAKFADDPVFEFPAGRFALPGTGDSDKDGRSKGSFAGSLFGKAAKLKAAGAARKRGTGSNPRVVRPESFSAAASRCAAALVLAVSAGAASAQTPPSDSATAPEQQESVSATVYAPTPRPPAFAPAIILRPAGLAAARDSDGPARTETGLDESSTQRLAESRDEAEGGPTAPVAPAADGIRLAAEQPAEPVENAAETASGIALFAPQRRPEVAFVRASPTTAPMHRPGYLASLLPGARDAHDEFSAPITRPEVLMIGKGFSGTGRVTRNDPRGPDFVSAENAAAYATEERVLKKTRKPLLLGVFGKEGSRSALVRLGDGSIAKVSEGDRLDGGRISAISGSSLTYAKNGRARTLAMP